MAFRDNLLKKIDIEKLAARVAATVEPQADAAKFDKASVLLGVPNGCSRE